MKTKPRWLGVACWWLVATSLLCGRQPALRNTLSGHIHAVTSVAFSPDGKLLASGSYDHTVKLWDVASGKVLRTLRGHTGLVSSVAFLPHGKTLVSGATDGTIRFWEVAGGRQKKVIKEPIVPDLERIRWAVHCLVLAADGKSMVTASYAPVSDGESSFEDVGKVTVWDVASGKVKGSLGQHRPPVVSLGLTPDGQILAGGKDEWEKGETNGFVGVVKIWDTGRGKGRATLRGHKALVRAVCFSPEGKALVSGGDDRVLKFWDPASGRELATRKQPGIPFHLAFTPDGKTLASANNDHTIRLWNVATAKELAVLRGHTGTVLSVSFSPDGKLLASGSYDGTIKLWKMPIGK